MIDLPLLSLLLIIFLFLLCLALNIVILYNWKSCIPFIVVYAGWMIVSHNKKLVPPTRPTLIEKDAGEHNAKEDEPAEVHARVPVGGGQSHREALPSRAGRGYAILRPERARSSIG